MAWPFSTLGLPDDATPLEVQKAWNAWRASARRADDPAGYAQMEQAFAAAQQQAAERDPSRLPADSYPDPWAPSAADAASAAVSPIPSPSEQLLSLVRAAGDYESFVHAVAGLRAWQDPAQRSAVDLAIRQQIADGAALSAGELVRLSRLFDWQPTTPARQDAADDQRWRQRVGAAWAEFAPPDPAYTNRLGHVFLGLGALLTVGLGLLILPRLLHGGIGLLIPLLFALGCAVVLIKWKR